MADGGGHLHVGARDPVRDGVVHQLVRDHFAAFAEQMQEGGRSLPRYVIEEFDAFLRCGVLACGFMRARCPGCGHDRLVAFSCKHRGVCSSCGGRRMSETAARQCDRVLPAVPYRQWVLSLPWELRLPVARDPALLNAVSRVFFEEVRAWLRQAAAGTPTGARREGAAVTYVQRFGGSLNLNPHLHMLVADGVFGCRDDGSTPVFVAAAAPTRDDLRAVIARVIERLQIIERRRAHRAASESCEVNDDGMEGLRRAAGGRGAFARVDDRGARDDASEAADARALAPLRMRSHGLVAEVDGFNLHAGVCVAGDDRDALERLCRYMARPAVASGRVTRLPDGNVAYRVKSPRSAGATHRVMTPMEFMARLAALVPPPRSALVRYQGVLAPNSPWRVAVVPLPPVEERRPCVAAPVPPATPSDGVNARRPQIEATGDSDGRAPTPSSRIEWARLLWRVWGVDALKCPGCGGRMRMIAALTERAGIVRVLEHLGVSTEVPRMRRSRDGP
ncbi:MAG: transposase [Deltaproteobacteria bacterium]|nr:transposase [Deltaproteobacteria bacterium]MBP6834317.1 transposase [Deltaproteobacteria bacterium]